MGDDIGRSDYTDEDFARFRKAAAAELEQLRTMLDEHAFDEANPRAGMELEINLVDANEEPALNNAAVLQAINDPQFVPELGLFNIEMNLPPRQLGPSGLSAFEHTIRSTFNDARSRAGSLGVRLAAIGILPTLGRGHLTSDSLSDNLRYRVMDEQMRRMRGGRPVALDISGAERLEWTVDSIAPEAACTSHQIHLQVAPSVFPAYWNASQAIAGIQLALGANSPYFLGRRLWAESRIALFDQSTDLRSPEQKAAEDKPRVWFGERWITSMVDLFEENERHFEPILPETGEEATDAVEDAVPEFSALSMLNGTVYRWNRPVYDVAGGAAHVRVENRVLPAGPTVVDMLANTAFYAGLTRALATQDHPVWRDEAYAVAERNFLAGARDGIEATIAWPGQGERPVRELVLDTLLPLAAAGLEMWGVEPDDIATYLGVIEGRATAGVNGASWQVAAVEARERAGEGRDDALRGMLRDYLALMSGNEPVHTWEVSA
ncbi:glutamate--cysteine ligase [Mariniluteicoccus flavus]